MNLIGEDRKFPDAPPDDLPTCPQLTYAYRRSEFMPESRMTKTNFKLPSGEIAVFIFGAKYNDEKTFYLQGIRSKKVFEGSLIAQNYHAMKDIWANRLAAELHAHVSKADALIVAPSSRDDIAPYRDAIELRLIREFEAGKFSRLGKKKSAEGATINDLMEDFSYTASGNESNFNTIIVLDDSLASGNTISAMLSHLYRAGLPKDCRIIVVTWAFFPKDSPNIFDDNHPQN